MMPEERASKPMINTRCHQTPWSKPLKPPNVQASGFFEKKLQESEHNRRLNKMWTEENVGTRFFILKHPHEMLV